MSRGQNVGVAAGSPLKKVQRERFALAVANGRKLVDAYREAFPRSARWKESSVYCAGSRLAAVDEVSRRISELRLAAASTDCASRHEVLFALSEGIREAAAGHTLAGASRLVDIYCRCMGFYEAEKVEAHIGLLTGEQRDAKIERLLRGGRRG